MYCGRSPCNIKLGIHQLKSIVPELQYFTTLAEHNLYYLSNFIIYKCIKRSGSVEEQLLLI